MNSLLCPYTIILAYVSQSEYREGTLPVCRENVGEPLGEREEDEEEVKERSVAGGERRRKLPEEETRRGKEDWWKKEKKYLTPIEEREPHLCLREQCRAGTGPSNVKETRGERA